MSTFTKNIRTLALASTIIASSLFGAANAEIQTATVKLLTANFDSRQVVQIEAGDFHFKPGQVAPIHTHDAPAVGYVAKGSIIYQVEGERVQILKEGDAFFEPTDKRILRFDNASATEEAIFIDFNLEAAGEPFIVFEAELKEPIDRRTLPTVSLNGDAVDQVDIFATNLDKAGELKFDSSVPTVGIVAEGIVEITIPGQETQRIVAGASFSLPQGGALVTISNASSEVPAKVITFRIL